MGHYLAEVEVEDNVKQHAFPQAVVSVSNHYKNPTKLVQSGHQHILMITCSGRDITEQLLNVNMYDFL